MVGACAERRGEEGKRCRRHLSAEPQIGLSFCHNWLSVPQDAAGSLGKQTVPRSTHWSVCFRHTVYTSSLVALALVEAVTFTYLRISTYLDLILILFENGIFSSNALKRKHTTLTLKTKLKLLSEKDNMGKTSIKKNQLRDSSKHPLHFKEQRKNRKKCNLNPLNSKFSCIPNQFEL